MHHHYTDIRGLTHITPKWHDENGVPRYCDFHPNHLANVYAGEAVLILIKCQGCGTPYDVALSENVLVDKLWDGARKSRIAFISDLIANKSLHYGDPPNTRCCAAGATMNSIPVCVLQYWVRPYIKLVWPDNNITEPDLFDWVRDPTFEVELRRD